MHDNDRCFTCGKPFQPTEHTPGYGEDTAGWRHCYACCALLDKEQMRREGRITLYLSWSNDMAGASYRLSNWPGTLQIVPTRVKRSKANAFGRTIDRYDAWFEFEGTSWHCVNQGDNQIARCRRLA